MSFASDVKNELCRVPLGRHCCAVAEAYGVLLYCHTFTTREIRIVTACGAFAERLPKLFRRAFGAHFALPAEEKTGGRHVLTTMDICGAMSLKTNFSNVITIYIKRDKRALLASILKKNSSIEDKVNRLIAVETERQNQEICDYVVKFDTYEQAVAQICEILKISRPDS